MSAFEEIGFVTTVDMTWAVPPFDQEWKICTWRRTIITGHDEKRIVSKSLLLQSIHNLANRPVNLHYKIPPLVESTLVLKSLLWNDGIVRRGQGEIK